MIQWNYTKHNIPSDENLLICFYGEIYTTVCLEIDSDGTEHWWLLDDDKLLDDGDPNVREHIDAWAIIDDIDPSKVQTLSGKQMGSYNLNQNRQKQVYKQIRKFLDDRI